MIDACRASREQVFLSTLYEGCFRIGEIGQMVWNYLRFDRTGVAVIVTNKTHKNRYTIRLIFSKELLIKQKSDYPDKPSGENYIFLNIFG